MNKGPVKAPEDFLPISRVARIVAPISDDLESSYFEGAIFYVLRMLGQSDIETKAQIAPPTPPFEVPFPILSREWFASVMRIRSRSDYSTLNDWNRTFLEWAKSNLRVSRAAILANLVPPAGQVHPRVEHIDRAGVSWSFPQVLAWITTRDSLEVARMQYAELFGAPMQEEVPPLGYINTRSDNNGPRLGERNQWYCPLQSDSGRRLLVGWLVLRASLDHCKCGARATSEQEAWENCECVGKAYEALISYIGPASQILPRYLPEPAYASFTLTWPEDAHNLRWQHAEILEKWPAVKNETLPSPKTRPLDECSRSKSPKDDVIEAQLFQMINEGVTRDAAAKRIKEVPGFELVGNEHARRILLGKLKLGRRPKNRG